MFLPKCSFVISRECLEVPLDTIQKKNSMQSITLLCLQAAKTKHSLHGIMD